MASRKYIFFDLGWTLEDETAAQVDRASKAAAIVRRHGIQTSVATILALQEEGAKSLESSVFVYALSCLGLADDQVRAVLRESRWDKTKLHLYPDAKSTLINLKEDHFVGLIANQSPGTKERLTRYGIHSYFDLISVSDEIGLEKPDPRIFELALDKAGCRAEDAWMIGDRLDNDIRPANQAGWNTIRVLHGYNICQVPRDALDQPDYTVANLSELVPILG